MADVDPLESPREHPLYAEFEKFGEFIRQAYKSGWTEEELIKMVSEVLRERLGNR